MTLRELNVRIRTAEKQLVALRRLSALRQQIHIEELNASELTEVKHVLEQGCAFYKQTLPSLRERKRTTGLVWMRFVLMYLMREYTQATLENIASQFFPAVADHGAAHYGIERVRERMSIDNKFADEVNRITLLVRNGHEQKRE